MIRSARQKRPGWTLVEILVVIAIITALAAMIMAVAPSILDKDRSVDAVTQLEGWLQNSRARALRDQLPRGVRLIVNDPSNPLCTEAQYIESPPIFVPNPDGPGQYPLFQGRVEFRYMEPPQVTGPLGSGIGRVCTIQNLTPEQALQVRIGSTLFLPTMGTYHGIIGIVGPFDQTQPLDPAKKSVRVNLDQYPDAQMGAGTTLTTYHFGLYGTPRPLLGEPPVQLPADTCVDLNAGVSLPFYPGTGDYDILFAPSGQTLRTIATGGAGHIFLWVRDPKKVPYMSPAQIGLPDVNNALYMNTLKAGGEQMLVVVKGKSGAVGAAPIFWPDSSSNDVYFFARKAVAGP